jgi:hypothetical protein
MNYAKQTRKFKRPTENIIPGLSTAQLQVLYTAAKDHGSKIDDLWGEYNSVPGQGFFPGKHDVHLLSRSILKQILTSCFLDGSDASPCPTRSEADLYWLFQGCPNRPRWYKIQKSSLPAHAFFSPKGSDWTRPKLKAGEEMLIIKHDDNWFIAVRPGAEETRYLPEIYQTQKILVQSNDSVSMDGDTARRDMTAEEFKQLLHHVDLETLQCWAERTTANHKKALEDITNKMGEDPSQVPLDYFLDEYQHRFFTQRWKDIIKFNAEAPESTHLSGVLNRMFSRGKSSRYLMRSNQEVGQRECHSYDVGLAMQFRLAAGFVKIPGVLQIQPYMQLMLTWNVKQVISALKARMNLGIGMPEKEPSSLKTYKERKSRCRRCVSAGQGFCDRKKVLDSMFEKKREEEDFREDECMERTLEFKAKCIQFQIGGDDTIMASSGLFKKAVCPCYDHYSGNPIHPRWITDVNHCQDLEYSGKGDEENRKHTKLNEFHMGFKQKGSKKKLLSLDDTIQFDYHPGCDKGYRCCHAFLKTGAEILRCMDTSSRTGGFFWSSGDKCKHFEPKDEKVAGKLEGKWSHMRQEMRCTRTSEAFEGHWKKVDDGKDWKRRTDIPEEDGAKTD